MTPTEPVCSRTELPVVDVAALPGYLVPRLVREVAGDSGKRPL